MPEIYRGFEINTPSDSEPWGPREYNFHKSLIDTVYDQRTDWSKIDNAPEIAIGDYLSVKSPAINAKGDGITDDTAAIQSALNSSLNVYFPPGTYKITQELVGRDNQILFGNGYNSIIRQYYFDAGHDTSPNNLTFRNKVNIEVKNLHFYGTGTVDHIVNPCCVMLDHCKKASVHHCFFTYPGQAAVEMTYSDDCFIHHNWIENGPTPRQSQSGGGIVIEYSGSRNKIHKNIITGVDAGVIMQSIYDTDSIEDNEISDNTIYNCTRYGILLYRLTDKVGIIVRNKICGNTVHDILGIGGQPGNAAQLAFGAGIYIKSTSDTICHGNIVWGCNKITSYDLLAPAAIGALENTRIIISNNIIPFTSWYGIYLQNIAGFTEEGVGSGAAFEPAGGHLISGNLIGTCGKGGIRATGINDVDVVNNKVYECMNDGIKAGWVAAATFYGTRNKEFRINSNVVDSGDGFLVDLQLGTDKSGTWQVGDIIKNTSASAWNSGTTYASGNIVSYSGKNWKSILSSNTNNTPGNTPGYWMEYDWSGTIRLVKGVHILAQIGEGAYYFVDQTLTITNSTKNDTATLSAKSISSQFVNLTCGQDHSVLNDYSVGDSVRNDVGDGNNWTGKILGIRNNVLWIKLITGYYGSINTGEGIENTTKGLVDTLSAVEIAYCDYGINVSDVLGGEIANNSTRRFAQKCLLLQRLEDVSVISNKVFGSGTIGIYASDVKDCDIKGNRCKANTTYGISIDGSSTIGTIVEGNVCTRNNTGYLSAGHLELKDNYLYNNANSFAGNYGTRAVLEDVATPIVENGEVFASSGTTTITKFLKGRIGKTITIIQTGATPRQINYSGNIRLLNNENCVLNQDDSLTLRCTFEDSIWEEITRNVHTGGFPLKNYTVVSLPSASAYPRTLVHVNNETGGQTPAFSDGTNWRRVHDRAVVS